MTLTSIHICTWEQFLTYVLYLLKISFYMYFFLMKKSLTKNLILHLANPYNKSELKVRHKINDYSKMYSTFRTWISLLHFALLKYKINFALAIFFWLKMCYCQSKMCKHILTIIFCQNCHLIKFEESFDMRISKNTSRKDITI